MGALALNLEEVHQPTPDEIETARLAARTLARVTPGDHQIAVVDNDGESDPVRVPANVFRSLVRMLVEVGNGNAVAVVPVKAELTTQQAADLLNVSRPHLISLLEKGELPFRNVRTHRRLCAQDVLNFKAKTDLARAEALAELARLDQEMGLYDDELIGGTER